MKDLIPEDAAGRRSLALAALIAAIAAVALMIVSEPPNLLEDFRHAYYPAGRAVTHTPQELAVSLQRGVDGFVNLPILAYAFAPFGAMSELIAALLFCVLGVAAALYAWRLLTRLGNLDTHRAALLLVLVAANGALHNSFKEGNTSHFILLLLVGGIYLLRRQRAVAAGVLFGLAALVKLPLLLIGAYFAVRGQWRVVTGGALVISGLATLSLLVFGIDTHILWYELCVKPFGLGPVPAFNVQSIHGFVGRLQTGSAGLHSWEPMELNAYAKLLVNGLVGTLYVAAVLAAVKGQRQRSGLVDGRKWTRRHEIELCVVIALACITSPLSWSHYYVWFLLPIALFLSGSAHFVRDRAGTTLGWIAVLLLSLPVLDLDVPGHAFDEAYAKLGVSYLLVGGVLMTMLMIRALASSAASACARG